MGPRAGAGVQSRTPLRVLHLAHVINRHDFIDTIVRFSDPRRFSMAACTLLDQCNIESPEYERVGIPRYVLGSASRWSYPSAVVRLAGLLRKGNIQIVHTHHYDGALLGVLAAKLARASRVVIGRHYHDELYLLASGVKLRALLAVEAFCNRHASAIVVPSGPMRALLVNRQRVPEAKIAVVPYGFDFGAERYRLVDEPGRRSALRSLGLETAFVAGNFARHHPLKGQEYLVRAFSRIVRDFPQARLVMVGDGPHHGALRALAQRLGLDRQLVFTGWRRDATRLLAAVDVVVHPTLHEAFPQLMVEALAHAKPLIITDVSGASDHIRHQRTGLLIPRRDEDAIYRAIRWTIEHPVEARSLGVEGRAYVMEHLDIRKVVGGYEACYEAVAGGRP